LSNVEISRSDLFDQVRGSFDLIVANLPYVPESEAQTMARELSHDPALALFSGVDGMDLLRRFIPAAVGFLKPGGWLALEIGYDQASQVRLCLEESGFAEIEIKKDLSGIARFPFAKHH
jgi:release factor glutamine methyltransferase